MPTQPPADLPPAAGPCPRASDLTSASHGVGPFRLTLGSELREGAAGGRSEHKCRGTRSRAREKRLSGRCQCFQVHLWEDARSRSSSSCVAPLDQPALPTHCLAHRSLPGLSCPGSLPTTTATTTRGLGEQGGAVEPHCCWLGGGRCGRGFQMPDRTSFHGGTESHQGAPGRLVLPATSAGGSEETGGRLLEARVGLGEAGQGHRQRACCSASGSNPCIGTTSF